MNLHFISGMPRAGSTLLSAILRQNPRFHAAMSGPVAGLYRSLLAGVSPGNESAFAMTDDQRQRVLRGVFENYYDDMGQRTVFDTHRLWSSKLPGLKRLFPASRVICCVRDLAWVIDSLERAVRRNPLQVSRMFDLDTGGTVYSRAEALTKTEGLVGFSWNAVKEAFFSEEADRLILVRYDSLVADPQGVLTRLYAELGEAAFTHSFDDLAHDEPIFDGWLGLPGLHTVKPRVAPEPRQTILPPDLWERYASPPFWDNAAINTRGVVVL